MAESTLKYRAIIAELCNALNDLALFGGDDRINVEALIGRAEKLLNGKENP